MGEEIISRRMVGNHLRIFKMYKCLYCGKDFEGRADVPRKYCSRNCSDLAKMKPGVRVKGQHAFQHICENCGKEYWNLTRISKYCSKECQRQGRIGRKSPLYKQGYFVDEYRFVLTGSGGYVEEHRKIVEDAIGRKLNRSENIHHINGDKLDNRIDNLALLSRADHTRIHHFLKGNGKLTQEQYEEIINRGRERIRIG